VRCSKICRAFVADQAIAHL